MVADVAQHDPGFRMEAFLAFAQALFARINAARASAQFADVARLLDADLLAELQAEGPRPDRSKVMVDGAEPVRDAREGEVDTVVVRFAAHATVAFVEDWTFQRPVAESAQAAADCPVCGEPLTLTTAESCLYCGTPAPGGLGGWRLVQVAALQAPSAPARAGKGCLVVALVAIPLLLVGLLLVILFGSRLTAPERQGPGPGVVTTPAPPTPTPLPRVTGHVTLSGSVSETLDAEMSFFTDNGGTSCSSQAQGFTGFFFYYKSPDGSTALTISVYAPQGSAGPGTYQTSNVTVSYALTTGAGQHWGSQPGQTTGTLVMRPDGSGTLSVTGLHQQDPGARTVRHPLVVSVSFSCG